MQRPDIDATIDLGDRPEAPLPCQRLTFERCGIELTGRMLLGEVQRDRERLEQYEIAVNDHRQAPVRIDRQKFRALCTIVTDLDRQMLVVEPKLLGHPERPEGARTGDAVDA